MFAFCVCRNLSLSSACANQGIHNAEPVQIAMRRLMSMAAFAVGAYYLWNSHDKLIEMFSLGAMGVALLIEFAGD